MDGTKTVCFTVQPVQNRENRNISRAMQQCHVKISICAEKARYTPVVFLFRFAYKVDVAKTVF